MHASAIPFCPLIRNAAKSDAFEQLGVQPLIADLSGDVSHVFNGVDTVIYAAGSAETEGSEQERLIDRDSIIKSVEHAKQNSVGRFVVISALLAYAPERSQQALRHYAQMKRESDDYAIDSGLEYLVLRPGTLTMEPGVGTIQIVSDVDSARDPVAREDVAEVILVALKARLVNKVIGFVGGDVPIGDALSRV